MFQIHRLSPNQFDKISFIIVSEICYDATARLKGFSCKKLKTKYSEKMLVDDVEKYTNAMKCK